MMDKLRSDDAEEEEQQLGWSGERFLERIKPSLDALTQFQNRVNKALVAMSPTLVDISELAEAAVPNLEGLAEKLQKLAGLLPPNWRTTVDFDRAFQVMQEEGIPLVWVPRADIVAELLAAPDRDARIEVLATRSSDVAEDCRKVLDQVTRTDDLVRILPMAVSALDAFVHGHHEPAQAMAVLIVETVVSRRFGSYRQATDHVRIDNPRDLSLAELRLRAALAPIGPFYVSWRPGSGTPMPDTLSRHITVHQADPGHYTLGNATVAIMLLASVLRGLDEDQQPG